MQNIQLNTEQQQAEQESTSEPVQEIPVAGGEILSQVSTKVDSHAVKIDELHNKITSLITEIAGLKEEVKKLRDSPVVAPPLKPKAAKEGQTQFKADPAPAQGSDLKPKGDGHARTGHYTPADVSIEKVFYCGNR